MCGSCSGPLCSRTKQNYIKKFQQGFQNTLSQPSSIFWTLDKQVLVEPKVNKSDHSNKLSNVENSTEP